MNYRLNVFGFLGGDAIAAGTANGSVSQRVPNGRFR
jgi:hypothetical protein